MKRITPLHVVFCLVVGVQALGPGAATADDGLVGRWRLAAMTGYGGPLPREHMPTVAFGRDGRLGGYDGCNTFGGGWRLTGDRLEAPDLIVTTMACLRPDDPELDARSHAFVAAFNNARIRRRGDVLRLHTPSGLNLTLRREKTR